MVVCFTKQFFVLLRQNSSQRREPSESALLVSTRVSNLAREGKSNYFCGFDALHSLVKLPVCILELVSLVHKIFQFGSTARNYFRICLFLLGKCV